MMKNINVMFEDDEYEGLLRKKGKLTWKEYIIKEGDKDGKKEEISDQMH